MRNTSFFNQNTTLERFGALTDGVYAIVLTLLVLGLKVPDTPGLSETKILEDLENQIPNFLSYVISFFVVATFWIRHHMTTKPLNQCNITVLGLNFLHLLFITITPYTALLFGHYGEDPIVVFLFSGSIGLAALSLHILHWYVVRHPAWYGDDVLEEWKHPNWLLSYPAILLAVISMALSLVTVTGAILIWVIFPVSLFIFKFLSR